jgi:hypothetical protein
MTANKHSRLLVVDASVAQSAGETEHPVSSCCRNALVSIRDICHRVIMTKAIREAWRHHASNLATSWLASMYAKKKVYKCEGVQLSRVEDACDGLSVTEQDGLRKDLCLLEAACAGDGIIVTRDEVIQAIWHKCHDRLGVPKPITWINPIADGVQVLERLGLDLSPVSSN